MRRSRFMEEKGPSGRQTRVSSFGAPFAPEPFCTGRLVLTLIPVLLPRPNE